MRKHYLPVQWNKQKKIYHLYLWAGIGLILFSFIGFQLILQPNITPETLFIRSSSLVAIVLLHFILLIGPLCRIHSAFLPLLYNRRHLGVTLFFFAALHGILSLVHFHGSGDSSLLNSLFTANTKYIPISAFPFEILGFFALLILFLMAASSHDFWLKNLSPVVWKSLHMGIYLAYALVILHVALGILQYESHPLYWTGLVSGFLVISSLHILAALKSRKASNLLKKQLEQAGFYPVCALDEIEENCAKGVIIENQNIAIFKYEGKISAVNNQCRHQMGPLAEGKIIDGCITCPWHGHQYFPANGQSPAPYEEKLETYTTKLVENILWVNPTPYPEGTEVEPTKIN
jgi:sulfoxide reductase heme-binding subunit YedZ